MSNKAEHQYQLSQASVTDISSFIEDLRDLFVHYDVVKTGQKVKVIARIPDKTGILRKYGLGFIW